MLKCLSLTAPVAVFAVLAMSCGQHRIAYGGEVARAANDSSIADDWPCWRGLAGDNHSSDSDPPIHWSATENIRWEVPIPGRGHASPCVVGSRILLSAADDTEQTQFLVCLDRATGRQLWQTDLHHGGFPSVHEFNSHASATPACDGTIVIVPFVNSDVLWVSGVTIDGKIAWQQKAGRFRHANGYGSSPTLYENLAIVSNDNQDESCVIAINRTNGQIVWTVPRPKSDNSASPIVAHVAGRSQLLLNGAREVVSLDPATGEEIWRVNHETEVAANTVAFDEDTVYASGNVPEKLLMAVRADGHGDVSDSHVRWRLNRANPYVPSPLVCTDLLFTLLDSGTLICRDKHSGDEIWKQRLGGNFFSSPVLAGNSLFASSDAGVTYVVRAERSYQLVGKNDIEEPCKATPVICGGCIYLRTDQHLYCIGADNSRTQK